MCELPASFNEARRRAKRNILSRWLCASILVLLALPLQASFIGDYALNKFTLVNTTTENSPVPEDGTVSTPDNGVTAILTGGNNGTGLPGTTDLLVLAVQDSTVQFKYLYSTLDEDPAFDPAGYLVRGIFTVVTDPQGNVSFPIGQGQSFGFRVRTEDNTGDPASLTISDFQVQAAVPIGSPEPSYAMPILLFFGVWLTWRLVKRIPHIEAKP